MSAAPAGLKVRVGDAVLDATDADGVSAALARENAQARIAGLDDTLNPRVIDPARVAALLAALPPSVVPLLGEHALYLASPELPVRACSPVTSFAGVALEVADIQGQAALVRARIAPDCDLARHQAQAARMALAGARDEVARLEGERRGGGDVLAPLAVARARRFAIAGAWAENAAAASQCAPADKAAADEAEAARRARGEYAVP